MALSAMRKPPMPSTAPMINCSDKNAVTIIWRVLMVIFFSMANNSFFRYATDSVKSDNDRAVLNSRESSGVGCLVDQAHFGGGLQAVDVEQNQHALVDRAQPDQVIAALRRLHGRRRLDLLAA